MSVETLIAATEASAASAPVTEEVKVATPTTETPAVEVQAPAGEQPATPETPTTPETAEVTEPETDEINLESTEVEGWDKYKDAFKDKPELGREWRNVLGQRNAYVELGPLSDVREIVQRIPTVEDAETLASQAENLKVLSETFRDSPIEFAERLQELDKTAYLELVTRLSSPEVLQEVAPHVLQQRVQSDVHRALEATYAQAGTDEERAALQIVARMWNYRPNQAPAPAPVNSELEKLRKEKQEREQNDSKARYQEFYGQTDTAIAENSLSEIQSSIKKVMPNVNEEQLKTLTQRAWQNVIKTVNEQPQTKAQINRYLQDAQKGRDGLEQHRAMVSFVTGRNSKQIPVAVKEAVNWLTKQIINSNTTQIDKRKAIAEKTKDVGTGVQGTTSAAAGAPPVPTKKTFNSVMDRLNAEAAAYRSGATR